MAKGSRLLAGWPLSGTSADADIQGRLPVLRGRGRDLAWNNPYGRRFLRLLEQNVMGLEGLELVSEPRDPDGAIDVAAKRKIEAAWKRWGKRGTCTVCGRFSWAGLQRLALRTVATDGEILLRLVRGPAAGNEFGFALQVITADALDDTLNGYRGSNAIRMGVEIDSVGRPVAYHVLSVPPGDVGLPSARTATRRERIPASQIVHAAVFERADQSRGVTWFVGAGRDLRHLEGYREAELVAARTGASKLATLYSETGDEYTGSGEAEESAADSPDLSYLETSEPGEWHTLPKGWRLEPWNPQHPNQSFGDFNKAVLRAVAVAVGVSYNTLASDLEGVNLSSLRDGKLDEREGYRLLQAWAGEAITDPVFGAWIRESLLARAVLLPAVKLAKFEEHRWRRRGWKWIDPDKEQKANERQLRLGTKAVSDVLDEQGLSLTDVLDTIEEERRQYAARGLVHPVDRQDGDAGGANATNEPPEGGDAADTASDANGD